MLAPYESGGSLVDRCLYNVRPHWHNAHTGACPNEEALRK